MANRFTLSVKGTVQGEIKGEGGKDSTKIPILGFSFEVTSPRDPQSGLPTGRRVYKPLEIFKEWGNISTQLFQARVTNENLVKVVIQEYRVDASGKEFVYMEIQLTNAAISGITVLPEKVTGQPVWLEREIETISFAFQKIQISNNLSKTTASDDWSERV